MAIFPASAIPTAAATGYDIDNSLRFNDNDSANLGRTPASTGNRKTWTLSAWVKRTKHDSETVIWSVNGSGDYDSIHIDSGNRLQYHIHGGGGGNLRTNQMFRDPSAWYHIVVAVDTTIASPSGLNQRVKFYVNGSQVTSFFTETYPSLNYDTDTNLSNSHKIGVQSWYSDRYWDGYLAEVHFIDGTALDPTSFGEEDTDYKHWKPKEVTGLTYGTNGFYLDFKLSAATSSGLGNDANGSNNWTPTNLASTDQMVDTPTNNFCTMNPLMSNRPTLSEGNLKADNPSGKSAVATIGMTTGKWYWETTWTGGTNEVRFGMTDQLTGTYGTGIHAYSWTGNIANYLSGGNTNISLSPSLGNGNIIGFAWDADAGSLYVYVNGTACNSGAAVLTGFTGYTLYPHGGAGAGGFNVYWNFGSDSSFAGQKSGSGGYSDSNSIGDFFYQPKTGYLALCTSNLPAPAVKPQENFNTVLYTGNGNSERTITGVGFQPDMLWSKVRSNSGDHNLMDSVRGSDSTSMRNMNPNLVSAESTNTEWYKAIASDGFITATVAGTTSNWSGYTYVVWNWKAGNATLGTGDFTQGSIASTCSRNVDAGFSIVSYTGNETSGATVGHGLSSVPEMMIVKARIGNESWSVYSKELGNTKYMELDGGAAPYTYTGAWNNTTPSTTLFTLGDGPKSNKIGNMIAYCFHSVEGYSKVGSYIGNGLADGTFVYTGFRPAYILVKRASAGDWTIWNNKSLGYNVDNNNLRTNYASAENADDDVDLLSNGFKWRTTNTDKNASGVTILYLAFAEYPFKYANAR
jgi:hypothetical protein